MGAVERLAAAVADVARRMPILDRGQISGVNPLRVYGAAGDDVTLDALGWYLPRIGDTVWILRAAGRGLILGPTDPNTSDQPPQTGQITAVASTTASVLCGAITATLPYLASYSPSVGDTVQVLWSQVDRGVWTGLILGKAQAATTQVQTATFAQPVDPPDTTVTQPTVPNPLTVTPTTSATWQNGAWRLDLGGELAQGDPDGMGDSQAWMWFGAQFAPLAGATITAAQVYLHADSMPADQATARCAVHNAMDPDPITPPATVATFDGPTLAAGAAGWSDIPVTIAQQFADGTVCGVGLVGTGSADACTYLSAADDPLQGAVRLWWTPATQ